MIISILKKKKVVLKKKIKKRTKIFFLQMHVSTYFETHASRAKAIGRSCCKYHSECKSVASVRLPGLGLNLCDDHFIRVTEERVARTLERYHWYEFKREGREARKAGKVMKKDSQTPFSSLLDIIPPEAEQDSRMDVNVCWKDLIHFQ